jgi:hypothetical protein
MPDIREARRYLRLAAIILGAISLISGGVLLSPVGRSSRNSGQQLNDLWTELRAKDREILPLGGIDKKVINAQKQIAAFYDERLPSSYAAISRQLGETAAAAGVKLTTGQYLTEPAGLRGLQRITIVANITGNYIQTVKFINGIERAKMFFLVDGVALGEQSGAVSLQIEMETYLKGT